MKTTDLQGAALDWAVAKCEFPEPDYTPDDWVVYITEECSDEGWVFNPSTNWAQGGPIIEREELQLWKGKKWNAAYGNSVNPPDDEIFSGPTPLIAAMRCYVASKLGKEITLPDELLEALP